MLLTAGRESLLIAEIQEGDYTVTVSGEEDTFGAYQVDAFLVGDHNGDGIVDIVDYTAWRDGSSSRMSHWKMRYEIAARVAWLQSDGIL